MYVKIFGNMRNLSKRISRGGLFQTEVKNPKIGKKNKKECLRNSMECDWSKKLRK